MAVGCAVITSDTQTTTQNMLGDGVVFVQPGT